MKITDDSREIVKSEVIQKYVEVEHVKTLYWKAIKHTVLSFPFDKCAENFHELLNYLYNWFQQKKTKTKQKIKMPPKTNQTTCKPNKPQEVTDHNFLLTSKTSFTNWVVLVP